MLNFKKLIAASALTFAAVMPAQAGVVLDSFDEYNLSEAVSGLNAGTVSANAAFELAKWY